MRVGNVRCYLLCFQYPAYYDNRRDCVCFAPFGNVPCTSQFRRKFRNFVCSYILHIHILFILSPLTLCYFCDIMIVAPLGATLNFYLKGKLFMKNRYREVRLDSGHFVVSILIKNFFDKCLRARNFHDDTCSYLCDFELRNVDEVLSSIHALYLVGAISETLFDWLDRYKEKTFEYCDR